MPLTEAEYIAYLKARAKRKTLQEADFIRPDETPPPAPEEEQPPFRIGFVPQSPACTADDLKKFESLENGGVWDSQQS